MGNKLLQSRIQTETVCAKERVLGYFLGPCLAYVAYCGLAGTYLTQFYTDVLGLAGGLLTLMPLIARIVGGGVGVVMGRVMERVRTPQGKARPWVLLSGMLMAVCGVLLYAVPQTPLKKLWVAVSYHLFFALAFPLYSLSHSMLVPLSTRDGKQRDSLAMITSMATSMIPGMLVTVAMPLLVQRLGVGGSAQSMWLGVMSALSAAAIPAVMLEYFFTRERVTEQAAPSAAKAVPFGAQVKACLRSQSWLSAMLLTAAFTLAANLSSGSMLYYCNWVLGSSIEQGAVKQILVNMVGQAPMGVGVVILWPLVKWFGKQKVTLAGSILAVIGCLMVLLFGKNMGMVLGGLLVKSIGTLPTYVLTAHLADAMDEVERRHGFRTDGFSASAVSIIQSAAPGLSQSVLLWGVSRFGYLAPTSASQIVVQSQPVQDFFSWCFAGLPMLYFAAAAAGMIWNQRTQKAS